MVARASTSDRIWPEPTGRPASRSRRPKVSRFAWILLAEIGGGSGRTPSIAVVVIAKSRGALHLQQGAADEIRRHVAAHAVDVLLIFQDDAEGVVDGLLVEIDRAEGQQGSRPVERLGHPRRLEEVYTAQPLGD